jgi:nucleoside 2-deoxyribosyltransferase
MEITNFAIIKGTSATSKDGKIFYKAKVRKKVRGRTYQNTESDIDSVVIRSDFIFGNGIFEFKLKPKSHNTGVIFRMTSFDNKKVRAGYSRIFKHFTIGVFEGSAWKALSSAGGIVNYEINQEINFKVNVKGSSISLFINNILLCEANISIKESPIEFIISSDSDFILSDFKVKKTSPKLFIVMQFSKEYNELYEEVIKPVSEKFGYECLRADEYYTSTPIISDIISSIQEATAIIAEITPDNPNVFYEIGYSHAIKKPTILLCDKKREKLPFDVSSFRTLFYENTIAGKKKVEESLTKYLENI